MPAGRILPGSEGKAAPFGIDCVHTYSHLLDLHGSSQQGAQEGHGQEVQADRTGWSGRQYKQHCEVQPASGTQPGSPQLVRMIRGGRVSNDSPLVRATGSRYSVTSHPACFPRYELYLKAVVSRHEHKSGCRSFDGGSSQASGRQAAASGRSFDGGSSQASGRQAAASGRPNPQQAGGVIQADATTSKLQQQQQLQQQQHQQVSYGSRSPRIGTPRGATPVSSVRPVEMRPPSDMEDSRAIVGLGGGFQVGV